MKIPDGYSYRVLSLNQAGTLTDFEFPIDGKKLIYASPTDGPELLIRLGRQSNDQIPLRPQGVIVAPFTRLYVSGVIGSAFPSLIVASPAEISIESRDVNVNSIASLTQLGTIVNPVTAKPFTLERAQAGQIFERFTSLANSVGNFSLFQILNPAASGKTVVVLGIREQNNSGVAVTARTRVTQHNTALTTLVGTFHNTNSGGAASTAELRTAQPAAFPGTSILDEWAPATSLGNNDDVRDRYDVLGPGEGLVVGQITTNINSLFFARIWEF